MGTIGTVETVIFLYAENVFNLICPPESPRLGRLTLAIPCDKDHDRGLDWSTERKLGQRFLMEIWRE